jgi:hypothetical protein
VKGLIFSGRSIRINVVKLAIALAFIFCVTVEAQRWGGRERDDSGRRGVPDWELESNFVQDKFTFVRIIFTSSRGRRRGGACWTDFPDSDLNFSYRLQELTSLKVDPNGVQMELSNPQLSDYPFIYMVEPGRLIFAEAEVKALRTYLLNGGFLMVDDFWGEDEWANFYREIKRVFPNRETEDLTLDHQIFNIVFPLKNSLGKLPQIPSINQALGGRYDGRTWERSDAQEPHYRVIKDDNGRIMCVICHNTDLGDGWEREGEDAWYFHEFSEKKAYPLGINIVMYALTH